MNGTLDPRSLVEYLVGTFSAVGMGKHREEWTGAAVVPGWHLQKLYRTKHNDQFLVHFTPSGRGIRLWLA